MALNWDVENIKEAWYYVPQSKLDEEAKEKEKNPNTVSLWSPTRYTDDGMKGCYQMKEELDIFVKSIEAMTHHKGKLFTDKKALVKKISQSREYRDLYSDYLKSYKYSGDKK